MRVLGPALVVAVGLVLSSSVRAGEDQRIALHDATTEAEILRIAETSARSEESTWRDTPALFEAAERISGTKRATQILRRHLDRLEPSGAAESCTSVADWLERHDRPALATSIAHLGLELLDEWRRRSADDPAEARRAEGMQYRLWHVIARTAEDLGDWERAREYWTKWTPPSWCGNDTSARTRDTALARCDVHLGRAGALERLFELGAQTDDLVGLNVEAIHDHCLLAMDRDRLDWTRAKVRELDDEYRVPVWKAALKVVTAAQAGDAESILRPLEKGDRHRRTDRIVRLVIEHRDEELDRALVEELSRQVITGDRRALALAVDHGLSEVAAAIRGRLEIERDRRARRPFERALAALAD